ncbi:hypothetical protein DYBT9275_04941 [Dyadobacter sp. CECT 9275]|uniref:Lipoprotein n=1 Tax=Dyadobacter helix TaxID=2822344 RepID=A0A916JGN9_9BACT|nr:hypothetical protein [Dyadobacter sp. CECT 9275]CAG5011399.1 hypothetical protein DYBT9275_04941 [Dyadobacter sp. CECT 9275]
MKIKIALLLLITSLSTTACGGRAANPVMTMQYGDQKKSCRALESEMIGVQQEISRLVPKTDKTGKNVALGVAGAFVLFPWFFMDFSHAEEEEVNAYRQRYNNLASLAADKGCDIDTRPIPVIKSHTSERFKEDSKLN